MGEVTRTNAHGLLTCALCVAISQDAKEQAMKCTCQSDYDSPCPVHGMNRPPSSALPGNEYPRAEGFNATTMSCDSCDYRTSSAIDATTHERSHRGHYVE